jgi:beta-lactamase regulating signal transducer with metallopeptidase domain
MARLAWTLAHFLWQGAAIAILAAAALRLMARRRAAIRYGLSVAAMALMLAAPVATFLIGSPDSAEAAGLLRTGGSGVFAPALGTIRSLAEPSISFDWTQWVVLAWIAGVAISSLRLAAGWQVTRQLLRTADHQVPAEVGESFERVLRLLRFVRPVRLMLSARVDSPVVVGWLRPAVLLPLTALTGLDSTQLRAVFAHELAHIRRHDFLVNLIQRCVESLLFYHPAVWWLSARIRAEREHCCDDLAIQVCGDPVEYARALVELERARLGTPELAMAATGSDLTRRIRRILGRETAGSDWIETTAVTALVAVLLLAGAWDWNALLAQDAPAPPAPPAPAVAVVPPRPPLPPVAFAAAAPMPPVPPAPPAQAGRSFRISRYDDNAWVMFRGGEVMMNGSPADEAEARIARRAVGSDIVWMRLDGRTYVIRDKAILDRIGVLYQPMEELGREQRTLGEKQRALGEEQRKLGEQMRLVKVNVPDLEAEIDRIRADLKALQSGATQSELGRLQHRVGELQSRIGQIQGQAGSEQSRIGQQQGELGRKQGELGRQQGELGRKQGEMAEQASKQVLEILREAVKSGRAKPSV